MQRIPINAAVALTTLMTFACTRAAEPVEATVEQEAIQYANETDQAINRALELSVGGREQAYQQEVDDLKERTDAVEKVIARADQDRDLQSVLLLAKVGEGSEAATEYLLERAMVKPQPVVSSHAEGHLTVRSELERTLGEAFDAVLAFVEQRDQQTLRFVYANGDINVAAVAAAYAVRAGILDQQGQEALRSRGFKGTFRTLSWDVLTLPGVTAGQDGQQQPVEGPQ